MNSYGFMPHGYCFEWRPGVLWLHVTSDFVTALSYYCIPFVLFYFIRKRRDLPFPTVFILFGAFIFLCGTTHLFSIWVLWHANYYAEGYVKALTASVSLATLITTIFYVPRALGLASPTQLAQENIKLLQLYRKSEERGRAMLAAVVDNLNDGIIATDAAGAIESFNTACTEIFGYMPDEVLGRHIGILMLAPFDAAQASAGSAGLEVAARRKDGKIFPLSLSVSAFKVDGVTHYSGILRDITAQKQAAENRERLLMQLTQSNTELERFAYAASHDMQEPVRMVHNFSQILQRDYAAGLDPEAKEYLDIIGASALRLRDMINDLLEHGRAGAEAVSWGEVDMDAEFTRVRGNLQGLIRETSAMITHDKLPRVRGDQVQLMRLLQNLVINGIKFQPPGQVPWIHVSAVPVVGHFLLSVRDNGIGIDPAYIEEIFQPFRRLHSAEAIAGTGLGLSLCRKIVENHGGRIWADSTPGAGTVVFFTLPNAA